MDKSRSLVGAPNLRCTTDAHLGRTKVPKCIAISFRLKFTGQDRYRIGRLQVSRGAISDTKAVDVLNQSYYSIMLFFFWSGGKAEGEEQNLFKVNKIKLQCFTAFSHK